MDPGAAVGILFLATVLGGPALLALIGRFRRETDSPAATTPLPWDWRRTIRSSACYALAFNLVFFIQELFLVLPKALTPGLRPTLYHNNHRWAGDHPLASLFQGTGAIAILVAGLAFAWMMQAGRGRSETSRFFILWMAYHGFFQSLPQVVVGAINPGNDVGMAMDYLRMSASTKAIAAIGALAGIVMIGLWMTRAVLALAGDGAEVASARGRNRFVFLAATLPALAAIPVILLFRVPRELAEVALPPIAVTIVGVGWIQANAWRLRDVAVHAPVPSGSIWPPLVALAGLLLFFQIVLRPGIPFY